MTVAGGLFHKIVEDDSSRRAYVVFSSIDIAPGKFMFFDLMSRIPGSKIFVNDEDNGWYVHGVPGLGNSVLTTGLALSEILRAIDPTEIITLGPSMGGYGAMLYGSLIKAEFPRLPVRCLSFGGEFILYARGTKSRLMSRRPPNMDYADIRPLIEHSFLPVTNIYGDADITDNAQADAARAVGTITSKAVRNAPHAVAHFLALRGLLPRLITSFANGTEMLLSVTSSSVTPGFGAALQRGYLALQDQNADRALEYLSKATRLCPENATAHYQFGNALSMVDRWEEALHAYEHAADMDPLFGEAHFERAKLLRKLSRNTEAKDCFFRAALLMPYDLAANLSAAHYAKNFKEWYQAEGFLRAAITSQPDHDEARKLLQLVSVHTNTDRAQYMVGIDEEEAVQTYIVSSAMLGS